MVHRLTQFLSEVKQSFGPVLARFFLALNTCHHLIPSTVPGHAGNNVPSSAPDMLNMFWTKSEMSAP